MDENKKNFIAKKTKILMGEKKYNKAQATAISEASYAQEGGKFFGQETIFPIRKIEPFTNEEGIPGFTYYQGKLPTDAGYNPELHKLFFTQEEHQSKQKPNSNELYEPNLVKYLEKTGGRVGMRMQQGGNFPYSTMEQDPNYNAFMGLPQMRPLQDPGVPSNDMFATFPTVSASMANSADMEQYARESQNVPYPSFFDLNNSEKSGIVPQENYQYTASGLDTVPRLEDPTQQSPVTVPTYNTRYNIANPYGGIDLGASLNFTGQAFGNKEYGKAAIGTGLSLLKGAREFMTGFASGKENNRVRQEYFDNLFGSTPAYEAMQMGGKKEVSNSEMLTGQFIADEGQGNTNLEGGELVKRADSGEVQQVVGEPHIINGKKADGVNATLNDGDKVLSTYTKIPPKDVKELKERYQLSLRKNATFADAQKAYDKKLGITKITDELAEYIEKLGKNESTKDETAKRLNESVLIKEIEEYEGKLDELKQPQSMVFEDLFNRQEQIAKKGDGTQIFDKNGKEVKEEGGEKDVYQTGGTVGLEELAKKHNISLERAQELVSMQAGGEVSQEQQPDQMQQIFQAVAQMLQSGATPEQIAQQLVEAGVPQEAVAQIIQQVAQQMQGQSPQEGSMSNPQEAMQGGGRIGSKYENPELYKKQQATGEEWQSFGELLKEKPKEVLADIKEKHPELYSIYFKDDKIPSHGKIGEFQDAVNKKYEDILDSAKKVYKDNPEKIKEIEAQIEQDKFIPQELTSEKGTNTQIRGRDAFLGNYTSTRPNFELPVLPTEDFKKVKEAGVNTGFELQQKFPELYKTYVGDKDLKGDFWLGEIPSVGEAVPANVTPIPDAPLNIPQERTETVMPWLPQALRLAPSSLDPMVKEQVYLPRLEPIKATTEPMLAEQERTRQTDVARVQASGLSPQQQEALLASGLSSSQMASNDAIAKVENYNAQNQFSTDQFNLGQATKEQITNANFNQDYQNKVFGALNAQERDWRNYYQQNFLDQTNNYKFINDMNLINAENSNYQVIPGEGVRFINNKGTNLALPSLTQEQVDKMTPAELEAYKQRYSSFQKGKQTYGTK